MTNPFQLLGLLLNSLICKQCSEAVSPLMPSMLSCHHFQTGSFGQGGQASGEHSGTGHEHRNTGSDHQVLPDMPPSRPDGMH